MPAAMAEKAIVRVDALIVEVDHADHDSISGRGERASGRDAAHHCRKSDQASLGFKIVMSCTVATEVMPRIAGRGPAALAAERPKT